MEHQPSCVDSPPPSRQRLAQLVYFEYRSMVMRRLEVTAEWRCPVTGECLAAIATDDIAGWRGLSRCDRECLWAGMERTYRDVCDLELMRIDTNRATNHTRADRAREDTEDGQRS